jgi:MFS family permease
MMALLRVGVNFWLMHERYALDNSEGLVAFGAKYITDFRISYHRVDQPPYLAYPYTPLYYLVVRAIQPLFGDLLVTGRLTSTLAGVAIGFVLGVLVFGIAPRRIPRRRRIVFAILACLLPFQLETYAWTAFMRVDTLALLFTFSGLAAFLLSRGRLGLQLAAVVCFIAAFYTKQTSVAAAAACFLLQAIIDWRRAAYLAGLGVGLLVAFGGVWTWLSHAGFLLNIVQYNVNSYSLGRAFHLMARNVAALGALLPVGVLVVAFQARRYARRPIVKVRAAARAWGLRFALVLCSLHFALSFAVTPTVGKMGASYNYFLEWNLSGCLLAALLVVCWFGVPQPRRTGSAARALLATVLLFLGIVGSLRLMEALPLNAERRIELAERRQRLRSVLDQIRAARGPVLTDDLTLLYLAGKDAYIDPFLLRMLVGTWDQTPVVEKIRNGGFALVTGEFLNSRVFYTEEMQAAIRERYQLVSVTAGHQILLPKP